MKLSPELIAAVQLALCAYAIWAVRHRNDRRKVPVDMMHALYAVAGFGALVIGTALVLDVAAEGRRFAAVREVYQIGHIAAAGAVVAALRILKGAPYDRR